MLEGSRVVVIVPAFHEEKRVGRVIETMPAFVDHIVVVDDGSADRTGMAALEVGDERVHLEQHTRRMGVGAALTTGYRFALRLTNAATDALCVMAGDGQMHPDDLESLALPIVLGDADYVKGDRFGDPDVKRSMGLARWAGGQVFTRLTSAAIGQRISDSQCGYTALARGAAARIDWDNLWPSFGYPNDLLGQLKARKLRVREVPVRPIPGDDSKLRLHHIPPIFYLIARAAIRRGMGESS